MRKTRGDNLDSGPAAMTTGPVVNEVTRGKWGLVLVVVVLGAVLGSPFLSSSSGRDWVRITVSLSSIVVLVLVSMRSVGGERRKWWPLAVSSCFFFLGDTVWTVYRHTAHPSGSLHTIADAFYIIGYPFLFLALRAIFSMGITGAALIDLIDSTIVVVSVFAMLWPPLIGPYLAKPSIGWYQVCIDLAPPLLDLVLIFLAARYIVLRRSPVAYRGLILAAIIAMTISDFGFDWLSLNDQWSTTRFASAGDVIKYVLFAAASLRALAAPDTSPLVTRDAAPPAPRSYRIAVLVGAGLVPEVVYIVAVNVHATINGVLMASLSCAVFVLVGLRMAEVTRQLQYRSLHDHLTKLPNRAFLERRLAQAHAVIQRDGSLSSIILIDLEDFKTLNDSLGHATGDRLLIAVGERLSRQLRRGESAYRIGGDVFVVLTTHEQGPVAVEELARGLSQVFAASFHVDGILIDQRARIGSYLWEDHQVQPGEALVRADLALIAAKKSLTDDSHVFTPRLKFAALDRFALVQDLRHAAANGELSMYFQPIVDLREGVVVGFEALMRWRHPSRNMVAPDEFIPLAEQSNLILELGHFALHEALAAARGWRGVTPGTPAPFVTVNLSSRQFQNPRLIDDIRRALIHHHVDPARLVVEVTEGVALEDVALTKRLVADLEAMGVRVALDDFGTGHSSLSVLAELTPSIVKVDQTFIRPTRESPESDAILESIVALCRRLEMTVLAEGVETVAKAQALKTLDCQLAQGYLWSPAIPAHDVSSYLAAFEPVGATDLTVTPRPT